MLDGVQGGAGNPSLVGDILLQTTQLAPSFG